MFDAGSSALTVGLTSTLLAACALFRFQPGRSTVATVLFSCSSMIATLFPLQLALVATVLLAWSAKSGSTNSVDGRIGIAFGVFAVTGFLVFIARQLASRDILKNVLDQALGTSPPTGGNALVEPQFLRLLRPLNSRRGEVERIRDLSYGPAGVRNLLDVYRPRDGPASGKPLPVLIQIHGSAWVIGNKNGQALPLIYHMAVCGWVVVSINYRLSPASRFPAHLVDVKRAIAWVRMHIAQYGGDPEFICLTGGSAGGHLATLAALLPTRSDLQPGFESVETSVKAAVPVYGRYDFLGRDESPEVQKLFVQFLTRYIMPSPPEAMPELWELASPVSQVHADAPPFFIIQSGYDCVVPVAGARIFAERLRAISRAVVAYAELPGLQHGFDIVRSPATEFTIHAAHRFLDAQHRLYQDGQSLIATSAGNKT